MGPFTRWNQGVAPDPSLKIPQFVHYSRQTRPLEHICLYKSAIGLVTNDKAILCKTFPSTLSDKALTWFTTLKISTIDSWHVLENIFLDKFSTVGTIPKTCGDLDNIKVWKDESLMSLERFKKRYNDIIGIIQDIVITSFRELFRFTMLYTGLQLRQSKTIGEIFNVAQKVALAESSALESSSKKRDKHESH